MLMNFIGCGRLGKTISKAVKNHGLGEIGGILTSTSASAVATVNYIGEGIACTSLDALPAADVYFITTPDDAIHACCHALVREKKLKGGAVIFHCSGSLSSEVLKEAHEAGCHIMSVHPIKSFANPDIAVATFPGTYCAYEGDEAALPIAERIFTGIGGILFPVDKTQKALYHASGVMANNYLVGLHYLASQCYQAAGVPEDIAHKVTSMLMQDALQNLQHHPHTQALTGPLQRGDSGVIKNHLAKLEALPLVKRVYMALGRATLSLTSHVGAVREEIVRLLEGK